jgi:hypothetical protein
MAEQNKVESAPESLEDLKKKFKPKKKDRWAEEMLSGAKSYDDKVVLVRLLTEKEQSRVVLMVKNMLKAK